jgi:glutaredoxin-related protein
VEALLSRFRAAHTQVLGVSVDSVHSHANWARNLGGVSFPLLSDFEPKGAVARDYGLYLDGPGISDRGTVAISSDGIVRHASSVTPAGERSIPDLADLCEEIDRSSSLSERDFAPAPALPDDAVLYVKSKCGFSRAALVAVENLGLQSLRVRNISEDPTGLTELKELTGGETAPALVLDGKPITESEVIVRELANRVEPLL